MNALMKTALLCLLFLAFGQQAKALDEGRPQLLPELERRVWLGPAEQFASLEKELVRLVQEKQAQQSRIYALLSHLYLRMQAIHPERRDYMDNAILLAQESVDLDPHDAVGYLAQADLIFGAGDTKGAKALLEQIEQAGVRKDWRLDFAKLRFMALETAPAEALPPLLELLRSKPASQVLLLPFILSISAFQTPGEQLELLSQLNMSVDSPLLRLSLGRTLASIAEGEKALKIFATIPATAQEYAEAQLASVVLLYRDLNKPRLALNALQKLQKSVLTEEEQAEAETHMTVVALRLQDRTLARKHALAALESSDAALLLPFIAGAFTERAYLEEVARLFADLSAEVPLAGAQYSLFAHLLSEGLGRHEEAIALGAKALVLDPLSTEILNEQGLTFYRSGNIEQALQNFDQALALNAQDPIANYNKACMLSILDKQDEALSVLKRALELEPGLRATAIRDSDLARISHHMDFFRLTRDS